MFVATKVYGYSHTHTHTLIQTRREERKRVCVVRIIALSILVGWMVGWLYSSKVYCRLFVLLVVF